MPLKSIVCILLLMGFEFMQDQSHQSFVFSEITFHSNECSTCPDISLQIGEDRSIRLSRTIFHAGGIDTLRSGNFSGFLDEKPFKTLNTYLEKIDWDDMDVRTVACCDRPMVTIILYYNGKRRSMRSMYLPGPTNKLVQFLTKLGTTITLPEQSRSFDFEVHMQ